MTWVVNIRDEDYDVYIGRPSPWGNPYVIGRDGNREEVIAKYEKYARRHFTIEKILSLKGKRLGCHCAPLECHGDVLVNLVEELGGAQS